jgi:hypothetical protein
MPPNGVESATLPVQSGRPSTRGEESVKSRRTFVKAAEVAAFLAVMYAAIQVAITLGVHEKPWWQRYWECVIGGSVGAIAGIAFFVIFGAIGWVCGPIYGAVGLIGLALGGAFGGLGLGALVNIMRNPDKYSFAWSTIVISLVVGVALAKIISGAVGKGLLSVVQAEKQEAGSDQGD